jgi:hypothetical protein
MCCALIALTVVLSGTVRANWLETFDGNAFDIPTWQFECVPDMAKTYSGTIQDGPDDNDYLALVETTSIGVMPPGSIFGGAFASDEQFTDVRLGAVVNVAGDACRNNYALVGRTDYIIDPDGSQKGYPGMWANCYGLIIYWDEGPANLTIEVQKVIDNDTSDVMNQDYGAVVPGLDNARSYYAELDIVGSDPTYVTGSLYEYKGGPLVARVPTLIDTNARDFWEEEREINYPVFASGVSGICGYNEDEEPAGYRATFDDVFSISDGPAAVCLSPANGSTGVSIDADLSWVEAAFATSRELWFGKEGAMQKVEPAPAGRSYNPGPLEFGQTYQWRVDQVGPSGTVSGYTWSFTTVECVSVDDFESYADDAAIETAWPHNITGAYHYVFVDAGTVHQGAKAMRFQYQNQYDPYITEATHTFGSPQDWTAHGAKALSLFFRGDDANVEQLMSIKLEDATAHTSIVPHPYTYAVQSESWNEWNIDLQEFTGVNLGAVKKISIRIGDGTNSGQEVEDRDVVYIDHIRVCPSRCFNTEQVDLRGDVNGDCAVDLKDLALMGDGWLTDGLSVMP